MEYDRNENCLREWNEGPVYCRERRISFNESDMYGRIKLPELMMIFTDAAGDDYSRRGLTYEVMAREGNVVFLISKMSIRYFGKIKYDSVVTMKTWEAELSGVKFNRHFHLYDEEGNIVAQARTLWLAVNPETRKIIRPNAYPYMDDIRLNPLDVDCRENGKIKLPEKTFELGSRKIVFSDIDTNGHVNNTRYAAFAEDCMPAEFMTENIRDFRINFVNEAKLGDTIDFIGGYDEEEKKVVIVGRNHDQISFECEFYL